MGQTHPKAQQKPLLDVSINRSENNDERQPILSPAGAAAGNREEPRLPTERGEDEHPRPAVPTTNLEQEQQPAVTDPETEESGLSNAELSGIITIYGIFFLTIGLMLVGDWSVGGTAEEEFTYGEGYTIFLMTTSLSWMVFTAINNSNAIKQQEANGEESKQGDLGSVHSKREPGTSFLIHSLEMFAGVSVLLNIFQLVENIKDDCFSPLAVACSVLKLLFIPSQLYLIYRARNKVTFLRSPLTGIMLIHIVITNVILYMWTFIKSKAGLLRANGQIQAVNSPANPFVCNCTNNTVVPSLIQNGTIPCVPSAYAAAFPWLYPFFLEFSLTASAMLAELWIQCMHKYKELPLSSFSGRSQSQSNRSSKLAITVGLFILIAHIGVVAVTMVHDTDVNVGVGLWYAIRILNSLLVVGLSAAGWWMLPSSKKRTNKATELDEILLFIATFGVFALEAFRAFPAIIGMSGQHDRGYAFVVFLADVLATIAAMVQPGFITKALHSKSSERNYLHNTIHEASIAKLLSFLNIGMWLMHTIDVEGLDHSIYSKETYSRIDQFQLKRYGSSWTLVLLFCFPIAIFYRLHSAIILYRLSRHHNRPRDTSLEEFEQQLRWFKQRKQEVHNEQKELERLRTEFFERNRDFNREHQETNRRRQDLWQSLQNDLQGIPTAQ